MLYYIALTGTNRLHFKVSAKLSLPTCEPVHKRWVTPQRWYFEIKHIFVFPKKCLLFTAMHWYLSLQARSQPEASLKPARSQPEASQKLAILLATVSIQLTTVCGHQQSFSSKSYRQFCTTWLRPEHTGPIFFSIFPDFNRKLWTFTPGSRS